MPLNTITVNNYETSELSLGEIQTKTSRDGNKYQNIPIFYKKKRPVILINGIFELREFGDMQLIAQVDDDNRGIFEEFGKKLKSLSKAKSLSLIKNENVYLKLYKKNNGETISNWWKIVEKEGKEAKKRLKKIDTMIGQTFEGSCVFSLANIFS